MEKEINGITITEHGGYISYTGNLSSGGGVLVCTKDENGMLDHTWQEIVDAGFSVLTLPDGDETVLAWLATYGIVYPSGVAKWELIYFNPDGGLEFLANSANDYPVASNS